jgi:hypothetical protein
MAVAPLSSEKKLNKTRFNTASCECRCGLGTPQLDRQL